MTNTELIGIELSFTKHVCADNCLLGFKKLDAYLETRRFVKNNFQKNFRALVFN